MLIEQDSRKLASALRNAGMEGDDVTAAAAGLATFWDPEKTHEAPLLCAWEVDNTWRVLALLPGEICVVTTASGELMRAEVRDVETVTLIAAEKFGRPMTRGGLDCVVYEWRIHLNDGTAIHLEAKNTTQEELFKDLIRELRAVIRKA